MTPRLGHRPESGPGVTAACERDVNGEFRLPQRASCTPRGSVSQLCPQHPQLLFELALNPDEDMLRDDVQPTEHLFASPDSKRDVPNLRAQPLDSARGLGEARLESWIVVQLDDSGSGPIESHPDRSRAPGDDILELSPFVDDMVQMTVDADELAAVGGPLHLLSGKGQRDQLDERELELPADLLANLVGERRVRAVGLACQDHAPVRRWTRRHGGAGGTWTVP